MGILLTAVVLLVGFYTFRLYDIQVTQAEADGVDTGGTYSYQTIVKAARGELIDCNGNVLVGNRASFNLALVYEPLFNSDDPNES